MRSKSILLIGLAFAVVALASCGGSSSSETSSTSDETSSSGETETEAEEPTSEEATTTAPAGGEPAERSVKVDIADFAYNPDPVRVQAGGKVIWLNEDSVAHTATADDGSFDTGDIEEGKLKSEPFKQPGVYTYHCEVHPQMHGTIEVVEEG